MTNGDALALLFLTLSQGMAPEAKKTAERELVALVSFSVDEYDPS